MIYTQGGLLQNRVFHPSSCCLVLPVSGEGVIQNECLSSRSFENFFVGLIPEYDKYVCYVSLGHTGVDMS